MVVVCGFADTMALVAKESYALSVTLSALKRRACLKILLLIKVKNKKINIRKFCRNKKKHVYL